MTLKRFSLPDKLKSNIITQSTKIVWFFEWKYYFHIQINCFEHVQIKQDFFYAVSELFDAVWANNTPW